MLSVFPFLPVVTTPAPVHLLLEFGNLGVTVGYGEGVLGPPFWPPVCTIENSVHIGWRTAETERTSTQS